jgi:hypothetical protein
MQDVKHAVLAAVAGAAALALAGCGMVDGVRYPYAKESASTIFLDSVRATTALEAVRVSGYVDMGSGPPTRFNVLGTEDERCGGTISFSTADFDLAMSSEAAYLKGSTASWQQLPGITREQGVVMGPLLADRWVLVQDADEVSADWMCRFTDELLTRSERKAVDAGKVPDNLDVTHKGLSEASGVKAVQLEVVDDRTTSDVWVSLEEPHHILKMTLKDESGTAEVVLSDFDFRGKVEMPKRRDILDPARLR